MWSSTACEKATRASRRSRAAPESIDSMAIRHAIEKIGGAPGGNQSRGGIGQHDFTMRAVLAIEQRSAEHLVDNFRVMLCVAAANRFEGRASHAEILGRDGVASHGRVAQFGDIGFAGDRNFI